MDGDAVDGPVQRTSQACLIPLKREHLPMRNLFVSHGAPTILLDQTPARTHLSQLGPALGRPRAIVCASAHWSTHRPAVGLAVAPGLIHDFGGMPPALYRMDYPAPGDPALGQRVLGLLEAAGVAADGDPERGLDHGVWVPLMLLYPEADIPVVTLSVQPLLEPAHHLRLGRALAPLTEEDVLILGSGGATHNLREVLGRPLDWPTPDHARAFEGWLVEAVTEGRVEDLLAYGERAPQALRNHPTPEHFLPFFVALGAAGEGARGRALHRSFEYGALAMTCLGWD